MKNEQSFSSHSNSFISQRRNEQSILNEFKRVSFGQQSFYFSVEPTQYSSIPSSFPQQVRQNYTHSIFLENYSFYEMFTFAIFEYLIKKPTEKKLYKLNKLKLLICSDKFLSFAGYMKGLLLKGLQAMVENNKDGDSTRPVGEVLMGSEKLAAFCQCWKEIIVELNKQNSQSEETNTSMIGILATFFDVDLQFYTKKGRQFQLQVIRSNKKSKEKTAIIPIILISSQYDQNQQNSAKEQSFSQISSIYGNWSYYILLQYPEITKKGRQQEVDIPLSRVNPSRLKHQTTLLKQYPQLFAIDEESSQIVTSRIGNGEKSNIGHAIVGRQLFKKGESLISEMINFIDFIQSKTK